MKKQKTFAARAKQIQKKFNNPKKGTIDYESMVSELEALAKEQESVKASQEKAQAAQGQPQQGDPGADPTMFAKGGYSNKTEEATLKTPWEFRSAYFSANDEAEKEKLVEKYRSSDLSLPEVAPSKGYSKWKPEDVRTAMNRWENGKNSPVTEHDFIATAEKYDIPMELLLAMAAQEGGFGTGDRQVATKNIFNWGNTTGGDHLEAGSEEQRPFNKYFDTWGEGLDAWAEGMARTYKPESGNWADLYSSKDSFVNANGDRYAAAPFYERDINQIVNTVQGYNTLPEEERVFLTEKERNERYPTVSTDPVVKNIANREVAEQKAHDSFIDLQDNTVGLAKPEEPTYLNDLQLDINGSMKNSNSNKFQMGGLTNKTEPEDTDADYIKKRELLDQLNTYLIEQVDYTDLDVDSLINSKGLENWPDIDLKEVESIVSGIKKELVGLGAPEEITTDNSKWWNAPGDEYDKKGVEDAIGVINGGSASTDFGKSLEGKGYDKVLNEIKGADLPKSVKNELLDKVVEKYPTLSKEVDKARKSLGPENTAFQPVIDRVDSGRDHILKVLNNPNLTREQKLYSLKATHKVFLSRGRSNPYHDKVDQGGTNQIRAQIAHDAGIAYDYLKNNEGAVGATERDLQNFSKEVDNKVSLNYPDARPDYTYGSNVPSGPDNITIGLFEDQEMMPFTREGGEAPLTMSTNNPFLDTSVNEEPVRKEPVAQVELLPEPDFFNDVSKDTWSTSPITDVELEEEAFADEADIDQESLNKALKKRDRREARNKALSDTGKFIKDNSSLLLAGASGVAPIVANTINKRSMADPEVITPQLYVPTVKARLYDDRGVKAALKNNLASARYGLEARGGDSDSYTESLRKVNMDNLTAATMADLEGQKINIGEGARIDQALSQANMINTQATNQAMIDQQKRQDTTDAWKRNYTEGIGSNVHGIFADMADAALSKELAPLMNQKAIAQSRKNQ